MASTFTCRLRKAFVTLMAVTGLFALAACDPAAISGGKSGSGKTVQVALLVPSSAPDPKVALIAQNLINSARLAVAELQGATVKLKIYDDAGNSDVAAQVAKQAADEGAQIILGPLYAQSANAVGNAVAGRNINVISFSNNPAIAGGNVFVLGSTFDNTARRLVGYAKSRGIQRVLIVNGETGAEQVGRDAIINAAQAYGLPVASTVGFAMSQQGVTDAVPTIVAAAESGGADALFLTSDNDAALPFVLQTLPDNGLPPSAIQYIGLTRWDIPASALSLPGAQGSWFALPDTTAANQFASKYAAAYGSQPHSIAGLGYDGIAAIGALAKAGRDMSQASLTQSAGFAGASGTFRFLPDGSNQRALSVATVENQRLKVIDPAPKRFNSAGF